MNTKGWGRYYRPNILPLRCSHLEAYWSSLPVRGIGNEGCKGFPYIKMYAWDERQSGVYQTLKCDTCGEEAPDVQTIDHEEAEEVLNNG